MVTEITVPMAVGPTPVPVAAPPAVADEEVRRTIAIQEDAGIDVVVDGEHSRDNFYSFLTEKVDGTRLMSLAEMLDTRFLF